MRFFLEPNGRLLETLYHMVLFFFLAFASLWIYQSFPFLSIQIIKFILFSCPPPDGSRFPCSNRIHLLYFRGKLNVMAMSSKMSFHGTSNVVSSIELLHLKQDRDRPTDRHKCRMNEFCVRLFIHHLAAITPFWIFDYEIRFSGCVRACMCMSVTFRK